MTVTTTRGPDTKKTAFDRYMDMTYERLHPSVVHNPHLQTLNSRDTASEELDRLVEVVDLRHLELLVAHRNATSKVVERAVRIALESGDTLEMLYVLHEAVRSGKTSMETNEEISMAVVSNREDRTLVIAAIKGQIGHYRKESLILD